MFPPVDDTLSASSAVVALVGNRIADHGEIPQGTAKPYITWFVVIGQPFDQLSGTPCGDFDTVQIDCWAPTGKDVKALALAVRDALDVAGHANRTIIDNREPAGTSRLFRVTLQADFIASR